MLLKLVAACILRSDYWLGGGSWKTSFSLSVRSVKMVI